MIQETETNGREWWPEDYCDEIMPVSMATPEAWLRRMPDGTGWTIASPYHDEPDEEAQRWKFSPLVNGQRVAFVFCDRLQPIEVTVDPDGRFEPSRHVDPRATWFWDNSECGEDSSCGDTLEEFARSYAEDHDLKEPETVTVGCANWSDAKAFMVKIDANGATLEEAGTA